MQTWRNRVVGAALTAALALPVVAQTPARPARIGGHPNFNGIWQALNTAQWDLEAHSARALDDFWGLGAIAAVPAGKSVVREGTIPYKPEALKQRDKNREFWPASDPEAKCFMLGIPRATYHNLPFQIFQGAGQYDADITMVYPFAATQRVIHFKDKTEEPVESWMGKSVGTWEKDTLVIVTKGQNDQTWFDRAGNFHSTEMVVTERYTLMDPDHIRYEATINDPETFTRPWTIEMPLYRIVEANAQLQENKCVTFADKLQYSDLMGLKPQSKPVPGSPQAKAAGQK